MSLPLWLFIFQYSLLNLQAWPLCNSVSYFFHSMACHLHFSLEIKIFIYSINFYSCLALYVIEYTDCDMGSSPTFFHKLVVILAKSFNLTSLRWFVMRCFSFPLFCFIKLADPYSGFLLDSVPLTVTQEYFSYIFVFINPSFRMSLWVGPTLCIIVFVW